MDNPHIGTVNSDYQTSDIKTDTQRERMEHERSDRELKEEAERVAQAAKQKAQRAKELAKKNSDNPVLVGNAVLMGVVAAVLGYGAYKRYQTGPVSWQTVGGWVGVIAAVGLADTFVSRWLVQKYPPKK